MEVVIGGGAAVPLLLVLWWSVSLLSLKRQLRVMVAVVVDLQLCVMSLMMLGEISNANHHCGELRGLG